MSIRRSLAGLGLLAALFASMAPSVVAQESEEPIVEAPDEQSAERDVDPNDDRFVLEGVGPGQCHPAFASAGSVVECRFPLIGRVQQLADWQGSLTVDQGTVFDDDVTLQPTCRFERTEIWCPHIPAYFDFGTSAVSLRLDGLTRELASFEVVDQQDHGISGQLLGGLEPVAFPGRSLTVVAWRNGQQSQERAFLALRQRTGDGSPDPFRTVNIVPLDIAPPGSFESTETVIEAPTSPGRYVAVLCEGPTAGQCSLLPSHHPFQVIDPTLHEVIDGHNRADAPRINLVFAGSMLPNGVSIDDVAQTLLTAGGPAVMTFDGDIVGVDDDVAVNDVLDVFHGPFAVEPLRSAINRFNFWFLDEGLVDARALFHNADPEFSRGDELAGFELANTAIVTLHHQRGDRVARSESWWTGFRGRTDVPRRDELDFAGVYLSIDANNPLFTARTLTHELGHALFDLRDEYTEAGRSAQFGYPNCADGLDDAAAWWADQIGEVDPFVEEYVDTLERFGLFVPDSLIDDVTVGVIPGGCYGGQADVLRPTVDSIMNSEVPIFGAVNRRRVEDLLAVFESRVALKLADDVRLRCFPATRVDPGGAVSCSGELARYVDPPTGGLRLVLDDQVVECSIDRIDEEEVRGVICPELTALGDGPWRVSISVNDGEPTTIVNLQTTVEPEPEPAAQTTTSTTEVAPDQLLREPTNPVAGDGSLSVSVAIIAAIAAAAVVGGGGWWFGRSRSAERNNS